MFRNRMNVKYKFYIALIFQSEIKYIDEEGGK
jgi:hypothetical protein